MRFLSYDIVGYYPAIKEKVLENATFLLTTGKDMEVPGVTNSTMISQSGQLLLMCVIPSKGES